MPQDEQAPGGLLSKVVKFVRNPTVNWSDLDRLEERESQYSKHVLKEMIERKRANDFVRKREFDQLRKLRQQSAAGAVVAPPAAEEESDFFDSGQPASVGQREGTLKKIDEIEAQMARQPWPGPRATPATAVPPPAARPPVEAASPPAAQDVVEARVTDFAATDIQPREPDGPLSVQEDMLPGVDWSLAGAEPGAAFVPDPGLEEAAIRFANGDDAGCEAALLGLVASEVAAPVQQRAWAALFDLYRATGQQGRFEAMAVDFSLRQHRPAPGWWTIADAARDHALGAGDAAGPVLPWEAPAVLGAAEVTALAVELAALPCAAVQLDWRALQTLPAPAVAPLTDLFTALAARPLRVLSMGGAVLEQLLRGQTVSGARDAPVAWWRLRLAWLRLAQRPDEFDLVALDYCITYEVSPPSWEDVRCSFVATDALPDAARQPAGAAVPSHGRLAGAVLGDASDALAPVAACLPVQGPLVIDCAALVRMDFAAAGSVLNWASAQQSAGRQVEFHGLHRLVAIFLHVIGVADHAKILARSH